MYSLNRATVIGNITRDPELRYTPNGQAVTSFSVATNRRWKNQASGEYQESTEYHDVVAWAKMAEFIANYLKKGNKIYIDGRLQTRSWETPDGVKQRRTEIVTENFVPLTPKGSSTAEPSFDSISDLAGEDKNQPTETPEAVETPTKTEKKSSQAAPTSVNTEDEINLEDIPF